MGGLARDVSAGSGSQPLRVPAREGRGEHEDRGSRFLGLAARCDSEAAFRAWLHLVRGEHPKARHHCWAFHAESLHRFSDDGEPGGTAGRPIHQVIAGSGLRRAGVIVVRDFGGVKLGTGGLVRAYTTAAARALDAAGVMEIAARCAVELRLPFAQVGLRSDLEALFPSLRWEEESFDEGGWCARGTLEERERDRLAAFLAERARGARWSFPGT